MLLSFLQGVFIVTNCFLLFCGILDVKLNYLHNTGASSVIVAWDVVSWSSFQLHNEFLLLRYFTKMENV